jgi:hypothetical protein
VVEFPDWDGSGPIDWDTANAEVATIPGNYHLATITSQEEQDFIATVLMSGLSHQWWIGAYQDINDPAYSEPGGGWKWVTGETWDFTSWDTGPPSQPDDQAAGDNENWAAVWKYLSWNWNDAFHTHRGFMRGYIAESVDPAPELIGLEVNQVVQDFKHSVELIEKNKKTYVRAYFLATGLNPVRVSGRLSGFRNGIELPYSPLSPYSNPRGFVEAHDFIRDRSELSVGLNFRLPLGWRSGTVELRFEPDDEALIECKEPAELGGTVEGIVAY